MMTMTMTMAMAMAETSIDDGNGAQKTWENTYKNTQKIHAKMYKYFEPKTTDFKYVQSQRERENQRVRQSERERKIQQMG